MVTILEGLKTRLFPTTRSTTIIVGTNALTRLLDSELGAAGKAVTLIDLEKEALTDVDGEEELLLARCGAKGATCVMAATADDERNTSVCRTAHQRFRVPIVISRLRLVDGVTSWARVTESGMVKLAWKDMVAAILGTESPSSVLARVAGATDREQIADVELISPVFMGLTIADLALDGCEVLAVRRNNLRVDAIDLAELHRGDVLTLVGTKVAIKKVRDSFTSL
jgi:Trk K+ transport system NAD-binding subunit